ncbi:hypothetical protein [Prochlorococcus marinus]|uniref:hypothetical protein n=1 Tax=Prochlorococcus TaxID=1218 RepID=UPI0007B378EE|nr:hypothetical protein [Prochlorococcus marinus]KZR78322.1 hypothetical protein PMIT1323_00287 [Prochlorococcus marinus str. MIT 1323]
MVTESGQGFILNGANYDSSQLSPEGKQLFGLFTEAQNELGRLENRKSLFITAQQKLINDLKPLLPAPITSPPEDTESPPGFILNGASYDSSQLSPEGKQLFGLLAEAQNELARLENRKSLLLAAQQKLINDLKALLPAPITLQPDGADKILGKASDEIPTTTVEKPKDEPAPFPDNIPEEIRAKQP